MNTFDVWAKDRMTEDHSYWSIRDSFRREGLPMDQWAVVDIRPSADYSSLIDQSNYACITRYMILKYPRFCRIVDSYFLVMLLRKDGKPSKAGIDVHEIYEYVEDYILYDEDDHSERECELTWEGNEHSIDSFARWGQVWFDIDHRQLPVERRIYRLATRYDDLPDNFINLVLAWLNENDHEALERAELGYHGDQTIAGYINEVSLLAAFYCLGYLAEQEPEDQLIIETLLLDKASDSLRYAFSSWNNEGV